MIKKIFSFIFLFLIVFHLSSKLASAACTSGFYKCDVDTGVWRCELGVWQWKYTCGCGCYGNDCATCGCRDNGGSCSINDDCCLGYCGDGICSNPPPTATATPVPCDNDGNNVCNTYDPYCERTGCEICPNNNPNGYKTVKCWTSAACKLTTQACYDSPPGAWEDAINCPENCSGGAVTPVPTGCQKYLCTNAPNAYCPLFDPSVDPCYGAGSCDNCGGPSCVWCGGVPPGGGTTPAPCNNENCFTDTRYPTTCYNDMFGICANSQWCYGDYHPIIPGVPSCSNIGTTVTSMPVTISWGSGGAKASFYEYRTDVGATKNTTNLSASVSFSIGESGTHSWQARSVNSECNEKTRSVWSTACTLCYETELCGRECGQLRNCGIGITCPTNEGLTDCSSITTQYDETPQTTGVVQVWANGCGSEVTDFIFPTWNHGDASQDDLVWDDYVGSKINASTWQSNIDVSRHEPLEGNPIIIHGYDKGCNHTSWNSIDKEKYLYINPQTCSVTATRTGDQSFQVTITGDGSLNPGSMTGRLYVERKDGAKIDNYQALVSPIVTEFPSSGKNYYHFSADITSTNSAPASKTINVTLPPGDYYFHCDMPNNIVDIIGDTNFTQCSGNSFCDYEHKSGVGSTIPCDNWKSCSASDNVSVCSAALCSSPFCGQTRTCGLPNCPDTDDYAPGIPTCSSIGTTVVSMPVTISWGTGGDKTDYYNYKIDGDSDSVVNNGMSLTKSVTLPAGSHNWQAQSVNSSCETDYSAWSTACTLCYEKQLCALKCGQTRDCSANCLNTDNGAPVAPTTVSPNGTSLNPAIFPLGTASINFDWNAVALLTDYYRVFVRNNSGALVFGDTKVTTPPTAKTFGPFNTAGLYRWYVDAVNSTCQPIDGVFDIGPTSVNQYFRINSPPVINSITITNNVGTTLAVETGNQNHICQSIIQNSSDQRKVRFLVNASDPNGGSEINLINLTWHGRTYTTTLGTVNGNNRVGVVDVTFSAADNDGGVWGVGATVVDIYGFNGQLTPRSFKVWNCQVPVSGSLYDKTEITVSCPDWAALPTSSLDINFKNLSFNTNSGVAVVMSVTSPFKYTSPTGVGLTWGDTYISVFNDGSYPSPNKPFGDSFLASGIDTRIIDLGVGTSNCPAEQFNIGTLVSAYSANPEAQIDFSFVEDQEAWYQVVGAGVKSKGVLTYGVPVTVDDLLEALTLSNDLLKVENGLVSATNLTNINGNNEKFGISPRNWWITKNTNDLDIYDYDYFYDNFYVKAGVGETKTNSWGGWATDKIYFVSDSLNIDDNLTVPNGETMMVIVKGDITIQPEVTQLDGIYIADGSIIAGEDYTNALIINGMLYAGGRIKLNRSFSDKTANNTAPAVKVNYSPGLIFNLDPRVLRVLSGWREE